MSDAEGTSGDVGASPFTAEQLAFINELVRAGVAANATPDGSTPSSSATPGPSSQSATPPRLPSESN